MTFIVHGATGAQGAPVLAALTAAGHVATAAVRDVSQVRGTPAVAVDYDSVDSLVAAYRGAEGVFVHLPLGAPQQVAGFARTIGEAIAAAQPARVVFSTSGAQTGVAGSEGGAADVLVQALDRSGVSFAVVEPRLYLENLLLPVVVGPAREEGVLRYPLRADFPASWSSHLDVADVVRALLTDHAVTGVVAVGALPALLGDDLAAGFSRHLGREVRYEGLTPDEFGRSITPLFGEQAAAGVVQFYASRQTSSGDVIGEDSSAQRLLGISPRTVQEWLHAMGV
ncbi:NmrA family NAD(P)-binding protein [Kineococcus sp. R8]|uniref:NmrA family NAD(P)-binding protein n=1 Tax=Kineococcus siccus TaxID=2696567 RepID=UPI001413479B|nr:NmrA family NAD(P)-binding protein [Kineococcus siccus]NAZ80428.1 NmrA family NAD(P)-binding protein [Kineococcus siccus]